MGFLISFMLSSSREDQGLLDSKGWTAAEFRSDAGLDS